MKVAYDLDEVFELAIQLEKNGALYYRKAAGFVKMYRTRDLLVELARMEEEHIRAFADLRSRIVPTVRKSAGSDIVVSYLHAISKNYVFPINMKISEILIGKESAREILDTAIKMEEDTIAFYAGIIGAMGRESDRRKVEKIIREEQKHVVELVSALETI